MKIKVTQKHIDKGTPKYGQLCPIAYAIKEATGKYAIVGKHSVWFTGDNKQVPLPGIATYFIITYDAGCNVVGRNVCPFEFDLDYELPPKLSDMDFPKVEIDDKSTVGVS
jgi:hypothetical protein